MIGLMHCPAVAVSVRMYKKENRLIKYGKEVMI